jgi:hypothetical protein
LTGLFIALQLFLLINTVTAQQLPVQDIKALTRVSLCQGVKNVAGCLSEFFQIVFRGLIYFTVAAAFVMFVWAGILYQRSAGDKAAAGTRFLIGITGLILALMTYIAMRFLDKLAAPKGF